MPGGDGGEAAALLRDALPSCRVLVLTTVGRTGYLRRAVESGAVGFLSELDAKKGSYPPRTLFTISMAALQLSRIWDHFFSAMASREAIHVPPTHATVFSAR